MSNLKVIVCAFNKERHIRTNCKYPDHNQDISSLEEHKAMWQKMMDIELEQDAGVPVDILIVCQNKCANFFDKYHGMKTKNGKIMVAYRDNTGGAFGGYSFAYENYKYDYYMWTEDDLFILGDQYYKEMINLYENNFGGLLAMIGISDNPVFPKHAHGGVGLVSRHVLDAIAIKGKLPYYPGRWHKSYVIFFGEIALSTAILKAGYKVEYLGKPQWSRDNFLMPYFDLK